MDAAVCTTRNLVGKSSKLRTMRAGSPDHSTMLPITISSPLDKEGDRDTFQAAEFGYDTAQMYDQCPEITGHLELTSTTPFTLNSDFGGYLCSELVEAPNFSQKLPELDKDTLSTAFTEFENFLVSHSPTKDEAMEPSKRDMEEEDGLSSLDIPRPHIIDPSRCTDDLASTPEWEEILSQQDTLIEKFIEIVDNYSRRQDCASSIGLASLIRDPELQSSTTTQCNFVEDRDKDRRLRNNLASRKSRAMRKERFATMQGEINHLRVTNRKLKAFVHKLDSAIDEAKAVVLPHNLPLHK